MALHLKLFWTFTTSRSSSWIVRATHWLSLLSLWLLRFIVRSDNRRRLTIRHLGASGKPRHANWRISTNIFLLRPFCASILPRHIRVMAPPASSLCHPTYPAHFKKIFSYQRHLKNFYLTNLASSTAPTLTDCLFLHVFVATKQVLLTKTTGHVLYLLLTFHSIQTNLPLSPRHR